MASFFYEYHNISFVSGDYERVVAVEVPQVVQVHHRGAEDGPVDHHRRGPQEAGIHQGGVHGKYRQGTLNENKDESSIGAVYLEN